jgi:hypothetical protein
MLNFKSFYYKSTENKLYLLLDKGYGTINPVSEEGNSVKVKEKFCDHRSLETIINSSIKQFGTSIIAIWEPKPPNMHKEVLQRNPKKTYSYICSDIQNLTGEDIKVRKIKRIYYYFRNANDSYFQFYAYAINPNLMIKHQFMKELMNLSEYHNSSIGNSEQYNEMFYLNRQCTVVKTDDLVKLNIKENLYVTLINNNEIYEIATREVNRSIKNLFFHTLNDKKKVNEEDPIAEEQQENTKIEIGHYILWKKDYRYTYSNSNLEVKINENLTESILNRKKIEELYDKVDTRQKSWVNFIRIAANMDILKAQQLLIKWYQEGTEFIKKNETFAHRWIVEYILLMEKEKNIDYLTIPNVFNTEIQECETIKRVFLTYGKSGETIIIEIPENGKIKTMIYVESQDSTWRVLY